jgi:hypothetical protein
MLLAGCGGHTANAGWGPPTTLIGLPAYAGAAGSPSGMEAFVWEVESEQSLHGLPVSFVRARIRLPDGRLTRVQTLSRADEVTRAPSVALDSSGTATAVWVEGDNLHTDRIMVAVRPPGGRFGTPAAVAAAGITRPVLSVSRDGAAVIAWSKDYGRSQVVVRPPGRCAQRAARECFGPVQSFEGGGDATVSFGANATAYVAWPHGCIALAVASRGRRFGAPQTISNGPCSQPAVAVGSDGSALIAWRASPPAGEESNRWGLIRAVERDRQGRISSVRTLSRREGDTPRISISRRGEVIVLWQQRSRRGNTLTAVVGRVGGTFGAPIQISPPSEQENVPGELAVDHDGTAIVVYDHNGGVFARVRNSGQAFAAATRLNAHPPTHGALAASLIAADNKVTAAWLTAAGTQLSDWTP